MEWNSGIRDFFGWNSVLRTAPTWAYPYFSYKELGAQTLDEAETRPWICLHLPSADRAAEGRRMTGGVGDVSASFPRTQDTELDQKGICCLL